MTELPASPFLPGTKLQFAWDSTSLTTFMECPRKYQLRILEGWVTRSPKRAIALAFGILLHKGVELYHRFKAEGSAHPEAAQKAVHSIIRHPEFEKLPGEAELEEIKEESEASEDESEYKQSKVRTRYHLIRALVWYFEQWRVDPMKTLILSNGKPAVELSFRVSTGLEAAGQPVIYCGHMDRVVTYASQYFVSDIKTTGHSLGSYYFGMFDISHQMTGYTFAGQMTLDKPVAGAMIDAVSLLVGGVKFGRSPTYRSKSQLTEFITQLDHYVEQAERFAETGHYPLNTTSCRFCEFAGICAKPPEVRRMYLNQRFKQEPAWNPLANR